VNGWSSEKLCAIAGLVTSRAGLAFPASRMAPAEAGIRRAMVCEGLPDAARYLDRVSTNGQAFATLLAELTIAETYFFRQREHFDLVRTHILPDLRRRHAAHRPLRAWSAGSASGEEAYSLAMTLTEANAPGRILATDICESALARARAGVYRRWSLRGLTAAELARALRPQGDGWLIDERLREMITFAPHNLAGRDYPPSCSRTAPFDLILCRNVLIYFDERSITRVTEGLAASLADDGWILTGPHDPPLVHPELIPATAGDCVVYRRVPRRHERACARDSDQKAVVPPEIVGGARETPQYASLAEVSACPDSGGEVTRHLADASFAAGDYDETLRLTETMRDEHGAILRIHSMANAKGGAAALVEIERQLPRHPLSAVMHLLQALVLVDLHRYDEAKVSIRRTLYLDPASTIAKALLRISSVPTSEFRALAGEPLTPTDREALAPTMGWA
jgi:chemotaxis methyl-accepting protein methylase